MKLHSMIQMPYLTDELKREISHLEMLVKEKDGVELKLELDYKEGVRNHHEGALLVTRMNSEWLFTLEGEALGYLGICQFGGHLAEINGMVHPEFRNQGVFNRLFELAMSELKRYGNRQVLLLSDESSESGTRFVRSKTSQLHHAEYEMYLSKERYRAANTDTLGVVLTKASNADKGEVAKQNAIYFGLEEHEVPELLPETEEARGMTIYLAQYKGQVIGKVHIETGGDICGIFGLGVLPEYRGKGFGRAILALAVNIMIQNEAPTIMLQVEATNKTALSLYQSCGFEEQSTMQYYLYDL